MSKIRRSGDSAIGSRVKIDRDEMASSAEKAANEMRAQMLADMAAAIEADTRAIREIKTRVEVEEDEVFYSGKTEYFHR